MKKHILKLSLIALLGFGLFACGNDDTSSASSTPASSNTTSSVATSTTTSTTTSVATSSTTSSATSSAAEVQLSKLADIKTIAKGTKVKFRGSYQGMNNKVYTFNGVQQYTSYFLADGNEWTQLFQFDKNLVPEGINIGDIVEVEGTTAHYTNKTNTYTIPEVTPTSIKKVTDETIVAGNWMTINETFHEALTLDMLNKGAHIENAVVLEKTIDAKYGNVTIDFKFGETNYTLLLDSRYTDVEAAEIANLAQNDIFSCDTYVGVNSSTSKAQFVYANNFTRTQGATVDVTGVTADAEISVAVGSSKKITASVTPSNATNKELTYTSNNTEIATVDTNGTVKGVAEGTTTITVASVADTTKTATVNVTVVKADANNKEISIDFSTKGYDNQHAITSENLDDNIALSMSGGTNSNSPKYFTTGSAVRFYGSNILTITAKNGAKLSAVEITFVTAKDVTLPDTTNVEITNGVATVSEKIMSIVAETNATTITMTSKLQKGQFRIKTIKVIYSLKEKAD